MVYKFDNRNAVHFGMNVMIEQNNIGTSCRAFEILIHIKNLDKHIFYCKKEKPQNKDSNIQLMTLDINCNSNNVYKISKNINILIHCFSIELLFKYTDVHSDIIDINNSNINYHSTICGKIYSTMISLYASNFSITSKGITALILFIVVQYIQPSLFELKQKTIDICIIVILKTILFIHARNNESNVNKTSNLYDNRLNTIETIKSHDNFLCCLIKTKIGSKLIGSLLCGISILSAIAKLYNLTPTQPINPEWHSFYSISISANMTMNNYDTSFHFKTSMTNPIVEKNIYITSKTVIEDQLFNDARDIYYGLVDLIYSTSIRSISMSSIGIVTVVTSLECINNFTVNTTSVYVTCTVFKICSQISIVIATLLILSLTMCKTSCRHTIEGSMSSNEKLVLHIDQCLDNLSLKETAAIILIFCIQNNNLIYFDTTTNKDCDNRDPIIHRLRYRFETVDVDMNQHLNFSDIIEEVNSTNTHTHSNLLSSENDYDVTKQTVLIQLLIDSMVLVSANAALRFVHKIMIIMKLINRQELQKWFKIRSCNNYNKFSSVPWNQDLKQTFNFSVTFRDENISINHSMHWSDSQNTYLLITMCHVGVQSNR